MANEKRQINIIITDLDDMQKVFLSLNNLFDILLKYYAEKEDLTQFYQSVLAISLYFGTILQSMGAEIKEIDEDNKDE